MARAKPSNWRRGGIELLDVSELFPDADLRAIVGRIGSFEGDRYDAVESKIFNVAAWLNASLHYDSRPTASEKRAALSPIAAKLAELRKAFAVLDQDTAALLKAVAGRAAGLQPEPPDFAPPFGGSGDQRYALVLVGLKRMEDWIHEALADLPDVKKGRKPLADLLQGVGGDRRFRAFVDVEELAPEVCPTRDLDDPFAVEFVEAGIGIGLQEATEPGQVLGRPFALAVGRVEELE